MLEVLLYLLNELNYYSYILGELLQLVMVHSRNMHPTQSIQIYHILKSQSIELLFPCPRRRLTQIGIIGQSQIQLHVEFSKMSALVLDLIDLLRKHLHEFMVKFRH